MLEWSYDLTPISKEISAPSERVLEIIGSRYWQRCMCFGFRLCVRITGIMRGIFTGMVKGTVEDICGISAAIA
ncbi:MAG: hypothetical protein WAM14_18430 [Candidatus Nitrosopolaris sp.]